MGAFLRNLNMMFYGDRLKDCDTFNEFKSKATELLTDDMLTCYLNRDCMENCYMESEFAVAVEHFIMSGTLELNQDSEKDWYRKELKDSKKRDFSEISKQLTFKSKQDADTKLPPVWGQKEDYLYNFLNYAFCCLCFSDDKIAKRYEVVFELDKNKVEVGCAGYSEKLDKELPFYITYFDSKPILIDPIEGRVFKFKKISDMVGLEKIEDMIVVKHKTGENTPLVKAISVLGLEVYEEMTLNTSDMRKSEREVKRAAGKKIKETPWRTVQLGYLRGSLSCIREHSLIALMVYGLETMKFAIMEGASILTVDHINSKHDDNRIDNFALLTRSANDSKGSKIDDTYYFDFFPYFMNSVVA